ncbi:HEAT repeat domain-containing protein [Pareuzebyella sediminis]|uniref:HEAT repeat domain-containing protein n=1 Tax=Pareuzebyella sediminis TaxID=2607998 RepID=UPI0011EDBE86|nr:HEAT repeat domain-containing protein [Pareuzebyella sediminis]
MLKQRLTYRSLVWVTVPEVDTDLLWTLSAIFVLLAVLYLISVFIFRNRIAVVANRIKQKKSELAPMVSEFLFYEEGGDRNEKSNYINLKIEIRELLKVDFDRKVLTEILLDLRKDVSGDTQRKLFDLYQDLGLEKDAFRKLESWRWELVSKGILELTEMNVESAYSFIIKFINDKRSTIRKQAEIATVTLKPEGINYFLDSTKYKISEWQQLKLLDVIRNQENYTPPRFKNWLTSTNRHVVLFALRAIKYYHQNDAKNALIELVKHRNNQIKQEAIGCIKEFHVVDSLPVLKQVFWKGNLDVKIAILDTISELGTESDIEFLKEVAQNSGNFSIKSKALYAINVIAPDTIMPTKGIEDLDIPAGFSVQKNSISTDDRSFKEDGKPEQDQSEGHTNEFDSEDHNRDTETLKPLPSESQSTLSDIADESSIDGPADPDVMDSDMASKPDELDIEQQGIGVQQEDKVTGAMEDVVEDEERMVSELLATEPSEINEENVCNAVPEVPEVVPELNMAPELDTSEENYHLEDNSLTPRSMEQEEVGSEDDLDIDTEPFSLSVEFLPIVTDNEPSSTKIISKDPSMENSQESEKNISHFEVEFEEIIPENEISRPPQKSLDFDISEIAFLPIVTDNEEDKETNPKITISGGFGEASLDVGIKMEEAEASIATDGKFIDEIEKLDFLPLVTDTKAEDGEALSTDEKEKGIDGFTLADFEVAFEKAKEFVKIPKDDKTVEEPKISADSDINSASDKEEDVISWLMSVNELREIKVVYEDLSQDEPGEGVIHLIPEPVYYDEHEHYMMGLLDDLEDLGDHREVPFLKELLEQENKAFVKDRIQRLIDRFTKPYEMTGKNEVDPPKMLPFFSVFADLFKNLDVESKLILLDEVVHVGDHKEIEFLDGLLEDPNEKIRKKASIVLKQLIEKLSKNVPKTIESGIEPLGAERQWIDISEEVEPIDKMADNRSYQKLLDNMEIEPSPKSEIFEIDFELLQEGEAELDENIMNLPVEMIVVSPDEKNILSQLRTFPKKMRGK